jgi:hypothetical protein
MAKAGNRDRIRFTSVYCRQYTLAIAGAPGRGPGRMPAGELRATMYSGRKQRLADRAGIDAGGPRQQVPDVWRLSGKGFR